MRGDAHGNFRGDSGELQGRCRVDASKMQVRCRVDAERCLGDAWQISKHDSCAYAGMLLPLHGTHLLLKRM